jgi:hypothetical protein
MSKVARSFWSVAYQVAWCIGSLAFLIIRSTNVGNQEVTRHPCTKKEDSHFVVVAFGTMNVCNFLKLQSRSD